MLIYQLYLKKIAPMKIFKFTLIALITTAILSCSDNSYESELELTNESLAGNHNITILNIDIESSAEVAGVPVTISNTTIDGDTFQVDVVFNTNGTYTAGGQYRVTSTVTPVATAPVTNTEIIVLIIQDHIPLIQMRIPLLLWFKIKHYFLVLLMLLILMKILFLLINK